MNGTKPDALDVARQLGEREGTSAGSWVIDGNTDEASVRGILKGIEDGDPQVMDMLPGAPLSGEWADGTLPAELLAEVEQTTGERIDPDDTFTTDAILSAFEEAYASSVVFEVERTCRAILSGGAS